MFLWPLWKFWTFTPWGWLLALVWNVCELFAIAMPFAPWAFGVIIGAKKRRM